MEQRPVPLPPEELTDFITRVLAEDVGDGDVTAQATIPESARLKAAFTAREDMIVAGFPLSRALVERLAPGAAIDVLIEDGGKAAAGQTIARVEGPARGLLTAERSALNILQHLSGIATLTHSYVEKIGHTPARLLDTRKTIPGLRRLEKYAVRMGGGTNHRMGLFDAIMIKDNHIAAAGGLKEAIRACRSHSTLPITIECDTLDQVGMA
ncbi:MAG: carboxylating nicotinate-nucleotide diphosphorylase, partial [Alphaproteobacteria bacterium]|nr:carboxylating nicotinate-nucleotide diphosphorylase [Alphaproteobacteria bacterium]